MKKYLVQRFEGRKKVYINKSEEEIKRNKSRITLYWIDRSNRRAIVLLLYCRGRFRSRKKFDCGRIPKIQSNNSIIVPCRCGQSPEERFEMARKVFVVGFFNEWDNFVELFRGTETQCEEYYEENIEECEEWDAIISPL